MKVKILCLGRNAKELEIEDNSTVEQAINQGGFPTDGAYTRHVNGNSAFDTDVLRAGDVVTLVPSVKGGN